MKPKITLPVWASRHYDPPPVNNTLRMWVREGRIVPAPVKIGRTYYVDPDARHIAEIPSAPRLIDRLRSAG